MKAIYLTKEEATRVIKERQSAAVASGGIISSDLVKMINDDISKLETEEKKE